MTSSQVEVIQRGFEYGVRHFLASKTGPLLEVVSSQLNQSPSTISQLLNLGAIYHNHRRCDRHDAQTGPVNSGDYLRVHTKPRRYPIEKIKWPELVVFENDDFMIVNKPAGIPVHPTVDNCRENLLSVLREYSNLPLSITHRLDVPTHGLLVLAKNVDFQRIFNLYLNQSKVRKQYRALVHGKVNRLGRWTHFMEPSPRAPKRVSSTNPDQWLRCDLKVLTSKYDNECNVSDVTIELETGRTHQIRAQLSCEGHPVLGDVMYGNSKSLAVELEGIALQSQELSFSGGFHFQLPEGDTYIQSFLKSFAV